MTERKLWTYEKEIPETISLIHGIKLKPDSERFCWSCQIHLMILLSIDKTQKRKQNQIFLYF